MDNVYFWNVFMACTLAFIVGYWSGKRTAERKFTIAMGRFIDSVAKVKTLAVNTEDKTNLH